jgi:hypothetical protein
MFYSVAHAYGMQLRLSGHSSSGALKLCTAEGETYWHQGPLLPAVHAYTSEHDAEWSTQH